VGLIPTKKSVAVKSYLGDREKGKQNAVFINLQDLSKKEISGGKGQRGSTHWTVALLKCDFSKSV